MTELTKDEAEVLANHLKLYLIQEIKDDPDYDSIDYLCSLVRIYEKCKKGEADE